MAAILRTGKFLRCFSGLSRNLIFNSTRETEAGNYFLSSPTCMCTQYQQSFATSAAAKPDLNLDRHLKRLDQDVRRSGRISRRDIEEVLDEIRTQRSATSSQSLLVIRCCGNLVPEELPEVRTAMVQEIWRTLNTLNVPMDISHYNALLRVYLENEHQFSPTDFLAELESKHIEPNRVTYQRLIDRYCQQGDLDGATRILEYMRSKNLAVNESVFNSLIMGHSQANDLESAKGILTVMKQANVEPSADTYAILLCCYARHGEIGAIEQTLQICEKEDIILLDKDLLDVIYHLALNGHSDKVDVILGKLRFSAGFNQDAVNIILRLVNKGLEDVGLKILKVMPRGNRADGQPVDAGSFFIRQLVKANRPMENILQICKLLEQEGLNPKALLIATEAGLANNGGISALPLLREMKNAGLQIRQHYFWPLICSIDSNQIISLLRRMQDEFSVYPNAETIRDYVIPNLKEKNLEKVVILLRDAGISQATAAASAAFTALTSGHIKEAAKLMESSRAFYAPGLFKQPLVTALAKTQDYDSYVKVVRQIFEGYQLRNTIQKSVTANDLNESSEQQEPTVSENDIEEVPTTGSDVVGMILNDTITHFRNNCVEVLEKILPKLVNEGLSINNSNATKISEKLGANLTPTISEALGKLSSGELEPKPLTKTQRKRKGVESLTIEEIERFISNVEAKGENSNPLKRHLLNACFRSQQLEKTLQVIEKFESEKFIIPDGVWAQLLDLYTFHGKISEALALFEKQKAKDPTFTVDNIKTVRLVDALIKADRFDEAIQFLDANKKPEPFKEVDGSFNYIMLIWRLLNSLAESGNGDKLQKVFDSIVENNYVIPTNVVLGPLIKVHLVNDDIQKGINAFEQITEKYKSTPWKHELACRLIQKEDAANLQRLTDLSTNIHGEVNSLYDLVFSFVECGRIRQARKILETPGLRSRPHRIDYACERYKNEGMIQPLEGLIEATKDLGHIDRNKIYYNLLLSYEKSNECEKALGLWTKMQEEAVPPSEEFLIKLAEILKKNNMNIPFVVPDMNSTTLSSITKASNKKTKEPTKVTETIKETAVQPSNINLMRKAIHENNVDEALDYKKQINSNENIGNIDLSRLIELLVRQERMSEATKFVKELLEEKRMPITKIFKFYLNKLAGNGDLETMESIGEQLTEEQKRQVSFDNRLCNAVMTANKVEQYLKTLNEKISNIKTPEEAAIAVASFPRGGAIGLLEKYPHLASDFEKIAEKYAAFNQLGPMNVLWMHLISVGDENASKAVWDKYLSNAPRLMFQRVLQTARESKNEKLVETVLGQLRGSKISEGAIGNAYSCLIDIYTSSNNPDKGLDTLKTAVKDVSLENINRTALLRLKSLLEEQNKEFPFTIPEKKAKEGSSTSSSSDDDVSPKRPETRPPRPTS